MSDINVTISALLMEGLPAADPAVTVTLSEVQPFQRVLSATPVTDFDGEVSLNIPAPEDSNPEWMVTPTFSRFMQPSGQMFFPLTEPQKTIPVRLVRSVSAWKPRFTPYIALASPRFDAFKQIAAVSTDVDLKVPGVPAVGNLEDNYDALDLAPQILAKMALLNLYAVLTDEVDPISGKVWFSYVQKIIRIDQERFVAEVDQELFDDVKTIVAGLDGPFAGGDYSTETEADFPLHYPNIPARYDCPANLAEPMITVKKRYEQGDVQLTMTSYKTGVYLVDCDMDEHLNLIGHTVDLLAHAEEELQNPQVDGTEPVLMHEYIVRDSAQQAADGIATVDLGYALV